MSRYTLLAAAVLLATVLVVGPVVGRAEDTDEASLAGPQTVAPNQGVAVLASSPPVSPEESTTEADRGPNIGGRIVLPPRSGGADGPVAQEDQGDPVADADETAAGAAGQVRPAVAGLGGPTRPKPVPWYRSGAVSLVIVLGAVAGVAVLVRRLVPSVRAMNGGAIEVLGRNHLSPKQSLALVRIGRRVLLLGVTAERLSTLCEIDEADEVAEILLRAPQGRSARDGLGRAGFDAMLNNAATGFDEEAGDPGELRRGSSERLTQVKGKLQGLLGKLQALEKSS